MGFWDVLKDIDDTFATVSTGYNRVSDSREKFSSTIKGFENQWAQIDKWERKTRNCKIWTVVLCILMIVATVCICIFL